MEREKRFLLRKAGGVYRLVDTAQAGVPYRAPLGLNESGARIWQLAERGVPPREIADRIAEADGVAPEEALVDIEAFLARIREWTDGGAAAT